MKLQQLEILVAAIECGTLTKAASHLFLAQPVLSLSIKELEHELGVALLQRSATGVEPTPVGLEVYHHAKKILSLLEETQNISAELENRTPACCFTSTFFVGHFLLMETYISLQNKGVNCAHYDFYTRENRMSTKQVLQSIKKGSFAFAIMGFHSYCAEAEVHTLEKQGFCVDYLGYDPIYLVVREGHPLTKRQVSLPSLRNYPYAVYENDLNDYIYRTYGKEYCQEKCIRIENLVGLRNYLVQTDAISVITQAELDYSRVAYEGKLHLLHAPQIQWRRQLYCVRKKNALSPLGEQFVKELFAITPRCISTDS